MIYKLSKSVRSAVRKARRVLSDPKHRKLIREMMRFVIVSLLYASLDVGVIDKVDRIMRLTEYWFLT